MPELPEVESVLRSLEPHVVGRRVERVELRRADVVVGEASSGALLEGQRVVSLERRGKQLAIVGERRVIVAQLGMTGTLAWLGPARQGAPEPERDVADLSAARHTHVLWTLDDTSRIAFHDPRRFGGLTTIAGPDHLDALRTRWSDLGPDALGITGDELRRALGASARAIKPALLDQRVLAGVGNIYADEALFRSAVHPLRRARRLRDDEWEALAQAVRAVLAQAIDAGGSTLRDFVDADGRAGDYRRAHQVYGRAGQACVRCGGLLRGVVLQQRACVFCAVCQPRRPGGKGCAGRPGDPPRQNRSSRAPKRGSA